MSKDAIESPFNNPHGRTLDIKGDRDDIFDHNSTPVFSKPHDVGKDTIPLVFEEGELGDFHRGPVESKAANVLSSPMQSKE